MSLLDPIKEFLLLKDHEERMEENVNREPADGMAEPVEGMVEPVDEITDPTVEELERIEPVSLPEREEQ